jgi:hypothetical protein
MDPEFIKPILYTDSVTVEQTRDYFPISIENFDTIYASLNYLKTMLKVRQRAKMKSFDFKAGSTTIETKRVPFAYGDRYRITAVTKINEVESKFILSDFSKSNAQNVYRIEKLMAYIEKNRSLFKGVNEIIPKFYNVIVITE